MFYEISFKPSVGSTHKHMINPASQLLMAKRKFFLRAILK